MFKVFILLGFVTLTSGYPQGAPTEGPFNVCENLTPQHGFMPQNSPEPYNIFVSSAEYWPGDNILVTLNATNPNLYMFKGFLVTARLANCTEPNKPIGRFINADEDPQIQVKTCSKGRFTDNIVTHTNRDQKMRKSFLWNNPDGGHVYFKFTVVNQKDSYWTNIKTGVIYDKSLPRWNSSCAHWDDIRVEYVDPSRLTTRPPYTTMYPVIKTDGDLVWPSSGGPEIALSFFSVFLIASHLFL